MVSVWMEQMKTQYDMCLLYFLRRLETLTKQRHSFSCLITYVSGKDGESKGGHHPY